MSDPQTSEAAPKRKMRSLVARRFDIQLPVLLIFVAFIVAVAIFIFREISSDRMRLFRGGQPITFLAKSAEGIGFGSELVCQGIVVGRVRAINVAGSPDAEGTVEFAVEAALEKPYARWRFRDGPSVRAGIGPSYLGLSSIELRVKDILPPGAPAEPQTLRLQYQQGQVGRIKDDLAALMEAVVKSSSQLGERVRDGSASSIERTIWNIDRVTEKLDAAVTRLTIDSPEAKSPLTQFAESADKLAALVDTLGSDVKMLAAESAETVQLSQSAVARLEKSIASIEKSSIEVMGETPAERRAIRAEMLETLRNLREASVSLKDLIPRVGDTGFGRMLIKKDEPEPSPTPRKKPR